MAVLSRSMALPKTVSETICKEGNNVAISQRKHKILRTAKYLQKKKKLHEIHIICV